MDTSSRAWIVVALALAGCGGPSAGAGPGDGGVTPEAGPARDAAVSDAGMDGPPASPDACAVPDVLFVVPRSASAAADLDGGAPPDTDAGRDATRWSVLAAAVDEATAHLAAGTVRVGLELYPVDPGGGACKGLDAFLGGAQPTNPTCQVGQIALHVGAPDPTKIAAALDPATATICRSSAIGSAAFTASGELGPLQAPGRPQVVVLVTDGNEDCMSDPIPNVQGLAAQGIHVYVVALSSDPGLQNLDVSMLNDLSCAGLTAPNFSTACTRPDSGLTGWRAVQPFGPRLYTLATDEPSLATALKSLLGSVCCGCSP